MFQFLRKRRSGELEEIIQNIKRDLNPLLRPYSLDELSLATPDFKRRTYKGWNYTLYEGVHRGRKICAKEFETDHDAALEMVAKEVEIASRMRDHPNMLTILGFCLNTERPMLIYEFAEHGNLEDALFKINNEGQGIELSWDQKMKIVIEIANSVAYLHHGLADAFIHRNIKPGSIFLDRNFSPKLSHFYLTVMIPEGETEACMDTIAGTVGYMDPECLQTGCYTQNSDVYGFGVLLFEILTQKRRFNFNFNYNYNYCSEEDANSDGSGSSSPRTRPNNLDDLHDDVMGSVAQLEMHCKDYFRDERIRVQVMEYAKLMKRCLEKRSVDRPDGMIQVEMELRRIKKLVP